MTPLTMTSPPVADTTQRKKSVRGAAAHHERELAELRADRELAVEYLKAAMASLDDPDDRAAGLLAVLKTVGMRLSVEEEPQAQG